MANQGIFARLYDRLSSGRRAREEELKDSARQLLRIAEEARINQAITLPTAAEARTLTDHQDINSLNVSASPTKRTQLVSLNHADASSLQTLPGIGVLRAEKIIAHRPYASLDELLSKKVLSKKQLTNIESLVSL